MNDVAIVRVEQLYPFPRPEVWRRTGQVRLRQGSDLVPGRADEPGRLVPDPSPPAGLRRRQAERCHYAGRARSPSPAAGHLDDPCRRTGELLVEHWSTRSTRLVAEYTDPLCQHRRYQGRHACPSKSKSRSCPSPSPTPPSPPGTRRPATRSSATRTWSTSKPTRSCSKCPRRSTAC